MSQDKNRRNITLSELFLVVVIVAQFAALFVANYKQAERVKAETRKNAELRDELQRIERKYGMLREAFLKVTHGRPEDEATLLEPNAK